MYANRTRPRAGTSRGSVDLTALAAQVAAAAGAPPVDLPAPDVELLDARGYRRAKATRPGYGRGRVPGNKGRVYPAEWLSVAECMSLVRECPNNVYGHRLRAAIVLLWQGALRRFEACKLRPEDIDISTGRLTVVEGKGGKTATITMAAWAWPLVQPWLDMRAAELPPGPILCVIDGPTRGVRQWAPNDLNEKLKELAAKVGIRHRVTCHGLRHAWTAQEFLRGTDIKVLQHHLRHENLGVTDRYLTSLGLQRSHDIVFRQEAPSVPATALLELAGAPA